MSLRGMLEALVLFALDPWAAQKAWRARRDRIAEHHVPTYEAYPEQPNHPKVRLVLLSGDLMEKVDLEGYSLREINFEKQWRRDWLAQKVIEAHLRLIGRLTAQKAGKS